MNNSTKYFSILLNKLDNKIEYLNTIDFKIYTDNKSTDSIIYKYHNSIQCIDLDLENISAEKAVLYRLQNGKCLVINRITRKYSLETQDKIVTNIGNYYNIRLNNLNKLEYTDYINGNNKKIIMAPLKLENEIKINQYINKLKVINSSFDVIYKMNDDDIMLNMMISQKDKNYKFPSFLTTLYSHTIMSAELNKLEINNLKINKSAICNCRINEVHIKNSPELENHIFDSCIINKVIIEGTIHRYDIKALNNCGIHTLVLRCNIEEIVDNTKNAKMWLNINTIDMSEASIPLIDNVNTIEKLNRAISLNHIHKVIHSDRTITVEYNHV